MFRISFFIPNSLNYVIVDNKYLYLYNKSIDYFFILSIKQNNLIINNSSNTVTFVNFNSYSNLFNTEVNTFLYSLESYFFTKIRFTGKGFKWKKKSNNLFLFFNRAHKCFFINRNSIFIRLSKNKVILLKNNPRSLVKDSSLIKTIRYNNIFTKRGLRNSRQIIFKKRGKTASK